MWWTGWCARVHEASGVAPAPARPGVVRTGLLSMVALVALGLTRLIHGALVSRATDNATYGRVGTFIAITTIASLLLPAGVASAASRYIPFAHGRRDDAGARAVHRFLARLGVPGAVVFGLGAGLGAAAWFRLDAGWTAQVVALAIAFSLYSIDKATLYGFGRVTGYVRLELATSTVAVLATVLVVLAGWRIYLVPLAVGYGLFALGARVLLRADLRGTVADTRSVDRRGILRYVVLACVGTLASQGFLQGTQLLANIFAAPTEVSYFAAAVALVAPMYFLPRALGLALFPTMSRAHGAGDTDAVRRQADLSTRALFVLLAPLFAVGILLAREALVVFGSARYAAGAVVLQLILTATFFAVAAVASVNALSSGEHVHIPVAAGASGALVGLLTVVLLGGPLGAAGVGLGYLIGTLMTAGVPIVAVWRAYQMPWRGPVLLATASVGAALAAGLALDAVGGGSRRLVADVVAAVLVLGLVVAALRRHIAAIIATARRRPGADVAPPSGVISA